MVPTPDGGPLAMEAYSVVLSVTALTLSTLLGGGGSITVLFAILQSRQVRKYSYTLVLVFFFLCCGLDLLWVPMEVVHLLSFHYTRVNPTLDFGVATFAIYIFLVAGIAVLIASFCGENALRLCGCFADRVKSIWPVAACVVLFVASLIMAVAFLYASVGKDHLGELGGAEAYLVLHPSSSACRVSLLATMLILVVGGATLVVAAVAVGHRKAAHKSSESFVSGQSNESNNILPHFLINQSATDDDNEDKLSNSPSSPRLPDLVVPSVTTCLASKGPRLGELPSPSRGSNMLSVNMAHVLGRRRHTICQIGDSGTASALDPMARAKQYNYVRKFSVDISALQAQLENPKIFKDKVPFQSDQDLRSKPNKPSPAHFETRSPQLGLLAPRREEGQQEERQPRDNGAGLKLCLPPRPPVITVSEEVREEEEEEADVSKVSMGQFEADSTKPTPVPVLAVKKPAEDEEGEELRRERAGEGESPHEEDVSYRSIPNVHTNRLTEHEQDFVKMTLLMCLTFFTCLFPLLLVEALKDSFGVSTYVNIATCARALSTVQTIIYPHILICMDRVVSKAVSRLKARLGQVCHIRDVDCVEIPAEHGSSSTSQV